MPRKYNASQIKSKLRQIESRHKQQVRKVNQEINKYNQGVKRAVNNYNRAVRQHNSKVMQNRSKIRNELRRLNSSNNKTISTSYRTSVIAVNDSYNIVSANHDNLINPSPFHEYIYSEVEQENANCLETANALSGETIPSTNEYSLQETNIMNRLINVSKDLDDRWKGALFALNPENPDAARHFCTSSREIFTEIFDSKAKDVDVFAVFPNCIKTDKGNATRREKIRYFLHNKGFQDTDVEDFIEKDIKNILDLFSELSSGTHGMAGKFSFNQLCSIKKRVEDGLIFLCEIAS